MNRFLWVSAVLLSFLVQTEALVACGTRTRTRSSSHRRRNRPLVVANSNAPSSRLHPPSISNLDQYPGNRNIPLYTVSSEFLHQESSLKEQQTKRRRRTRTATTLIVSLTLAAASLFLMPLRATAATAVRQASSSVVPIEVALASSEALHAASVLSPSAPTIITTVASPVSAIVELQLSLRIFVAALIGACLGKERSLAKHSAGVRTMALVSMGAAAFTVCSAYGFTSIHGGRFDPSRMASNVASGVGFVGAGVITTSASGPTKNVVHGLTTAATIWLSAGVGVACGVGLYRMASISAAITIGILRLGRVKPKHQKVSSSSDQDLQESRVLELKPPSDYSYEVDLDADLEEDDDYHAETHDTTTWDEHVHDDDGDEDEQDHISEDMQDLVIAAWRNHTHTERRPTQEVSQRQFENAAE